MPNMPIINRSIVMGAAAAVSLMYIVSIIKRRNRRQPRRFKARPINQLRATYGHFNTLIRHMEHLEWDHGEYFKYTRMTPAIFTYLVELLGPTLQKDETKKPLSPAHRLMLGIHFLAEGCSLQEIAWNYRVGKTTAHVIVKEVCNALWSVMAPIVLPVPSEDDWNNVVEEYFRMWNLPNCVGAVDGKHVAVQAPVNTGSSFFNYKKHFSIILMAVVDANYRFLLVDIGGYGANHDSLVFKSSAFGSALLDGTLPIPGPKVLPRTNVPFPCFFVGDEAFPLHKNIMRPYGGAGLGDTKRIFNYRLSRGRRTVENAFGILCQRWRILRRTIIGNVDTCEEIVQACIVLHNVLQRKEADLPPAERRYCPTGFADHIDEQGILQLGQWREDEFRLRRVSQLGSNNQSRALQQQRDILADYFRSDVGAVQWQEDHILRGSIPGG